MSIFTTARRVIRGPVSGQLPFDIVTLSYDERFLRRKRLTTVHDMSFMVNLAETTSLQDRDLLELDDGRLIEVIAAEEPVVEITGPALTRFAWHIGNRHTPCQIEQDRLLIRQDHVIEAMLTQLGATPVSYTHLDVYKRQVENTLAAIKGRTIHAFHTEGAGGGHAPDIIKVCLLYTSRCV